MKNRRLYESFAQELQAAHNMRYDSYDLLPKQRRERSNEQYLQEHNGDWFSFYDLMIEKHQCWTPITDILFTFNYVYQRYQNDENYAVRIFIERCTNSDISHIKNEVVSYFKRKNFQCNVYSVLMNNATDNIKEMTDEIQQSTVPSLVFVDADNHTYDDLMSGELSAEEVGNYIDDITEKILPASGVLVYMERYPQYDGDAMTDADPYGYDDPDRHNHEETDYPEGYGTMEIDFDNVNESVSSWLEQNNKDIAKAVDILSDIIMEDYVDLDCFRNATDLAECDYNDLQLADYLMDYYSEYYSRMIDDMISEPYSIKEFITKKKVNIMYCQWERLTKEYWEEWLEDDYPELVEAIYNLRDVSKITDKDLLGGGGFESMRDLEIGVAKAVTEKIKKELL